ncbi:methyl-accepting chemotaxis protein [Herbaspirillum sp. Sphag1AN]|uniref:methyl-accepting chemotaxis protein n=1 Tax=unclassified Herbaspirillum TaxID=2624150 RepID=UPI00161A2038|nr:MULTISPECIES: methyl-accepting chemotaxis protein [unclassified Herbaspirillum]MBB3211732.1 methyl-accepting chemotaxis protein [Herbaspirillum sp. Sphag1AN]MBB3245000.1 methyl-accepting chemotaxis protein [Herbaspirillum sp. Sphag64]
MTIAKKLYLLLACVVVGLIVLTGISIAQINRVNTAASYATVNTVPSLHDIDDALENTYSIRVAIWKFISDPSPTVRGGAEKKMANAHDKVIAAFDKYEKDDLSDDKDREFLKKDRETFDAYEIYRQKLMGFAVAGKQDDAINAMINAQATVDAMMNALREHKKYNEELGRTGADDANKTVATANAMTIGVSIFVIAIITFVALSLARKISGSLNEAVAVTQAIAEGDLTQTIPTNSNDEVGVLMKALSQMNSSLSNIVGDVRNSVSTIATASSEIASGNLDLSSRTEAQAGSLEETASAMEELTSTVKQNADNARQANQLAMSASTVAGEGGEVVSQVVTTMDAINTSARKIVEIISVIDGIAFQTNILALNAAVEAARAGEQGRGFAVVASEVRTLAQRSAAAAKEIKELIDESVNNVEAGSKLVAQAGSTMEQVVNSVRRVTDVVSEITAASSEQSDGIEQVNQAITQMDEVTQQNAALVEEAAAASQSLQEQAKHLEQAVAVFKLDNSQQPQHGTAATANATTKKSAQASTKKTTFKAVSAPAIAKVRHAASPSHGLVPALAGDSNTSWEQF